MKTFFEIAVDCVGKSRSSEMLINAISKALLEAYDKGMDRNCDEEYQKGFRDGYVFNYRENLAKFARHIHSRKS